MSYSVKEVFFSLQGEGANTGRAAVFCRFAGCNLWSGRETDRATAACRFCDTDFVGVDGGGGGRFSSPRALAEAVANAWRGDRPVRGRPLLVCTGGEPLLQLDGVLVEAFHEEGFEVAVETNGTQPIPPGVDWVCVSPKSRMPLIVTQGDEMKLVFPQEDAPPARFADLGFRHFCLQPMDGPQLDRNRRLAVQYCLEHPQWRLSLQTHKLLNIQ